VSKKELHGSFAEGLVIESIEPSRFEVRPDLKDLSFSQGGPRGCSWWCEGWREVAILYDNIKGPRCSLGPPVLSSGLLLFLLQRLLQLSVALILCTSSTSDYPQGDSNPCLSRERAMS
jgi:hypothetical protein